MIWEEADFSHFSIFDFGFLIFDFGRFVFGLASDA